MDRNAIFATVLVVLILVGYQWYLSRFEAPQTETPTATTSAPPASAPPAASAPVPQTSVVRPPTQPIVAPKAYTPTAQRQLASRDITVKTPLVDATFSTLGARATHWQLKSYHMANGAPVELVAEGRPAQTPGALEAWVDDEQLRGVFEADKDHIDLTQGKQSDTLTFTYVTLAGLETQKTITFFADRYQVDVVVRVRNLSGAAADTRVRLAWGPGLRNSHDKKASALQPPTLWIDGKRHQEDMSKLAGEKSLSGDISWAALQDTYFTAALLPTEPAKGWQAFVAKAPEDQPIVGLLTPKQNLSADGRLEVKAVLYAGPRDLDILKSVGQGLDQMIDLGWFDFLARPALWLLKLLYQVTGNYGVAIILVTILQKVAFHPLTHKSLKSMQAMQALQPKIQALQERYKNNPQKKQEETMALYRKHGVNPMGGCLPMLIQIPIFIALYNALSSSVEMWQAHFLWIRDLTQPDSLFGITLWQGYPLNFLALLMGASMWLQQKLTPTAGDPRQAQMMLWTMPIIFTFMFWSFPSGLVLYWLVNNVLQIGQQWLINRHSGRPVPPEPQAA